MPLSYKPDIIWIIIDGIRPDKLRSCGNLKRPHLFIDEILLKGSLFNTVISSGVNSRTSMHAAFTSLYPSINKVNAYNYNLLTKFDPLALAITDILKHNGYRTFRYQDVVKWRNMIDSEQYTPTSGFDVWESSGYRSINETPNYSFSIPKRDAFIATFNKSPSPKFAFFQLLTSHDLNMEIINYMYRARGYFGHNSRSYEYNLLKVSEDFEEVWKKLQVTDETLVVVSTDHGARLDMDLYKEERRYGLRLRDISMNAFCSFIGPNIPNQVINRMVRTIDIVPTILDIANCQPLLGQGKSLLPLIRGEKFPELYGFMEVGGIYENPPSPDKPNVWGVRTEKWKYWKHAWRGEWLINLENDPDEEVNLIGKGFPIENKLRKLMKEELIETTKSAEQIYLENAKARSMNTYFNKRQIVPEVSLFLLVQEKSPHLPDVIDSILNQKCVYFELIIIDTTSDGSAKTLAERYQDYRLSYTQYQSDTPLTSIFSKARGQFISCISPNMIYTPFFLYKLRNILRAKSKVALVYSNYSYIDQIKVTKAIDVQKIFNETNNIGYCFLAWKKMIRDVQNSEIALFNIDNLYLPLENDCLISYFPQPLGYLHHKVGIFTLGVHFLYKIASKIVELGKEGIALGLKSGWKRVLREYRELVKLF